MEQGSEFVGELSDVQQEEEFVPLPIAPVRVQQNGPVQIHELPSVSGGSRSFTLAAADPPKRVGNADPRRRRVTLIGDQAFYVGENANEVSSRYSAKWPANVPCVITHMEEIYVGVAADGILSVVTENWAS